MNPRDAEAYFQLGRTCRSQGRWPEAEAALVKALELDPLGHRARMELGALYQDQNRFPEAAAEFEKDLAIDPDNGGTHRQLGRIYLRLGRWSEAEAALRKALEQDPRDGGACFELGVLYRGQDQFPEAAAEFEKAIAIDPNMAGVHSQLGRIYRRQGRWAEAEAALRRALERDPRDGDVQFELGAIYADQNRFIEAAAEFERAIVIDPHMVGAYGYLGRMYRGQGRLSEAEAALRKALELDPRNSEARAQLGALYEGQGRSLQAVAEFERAIALEPNHGWVHYHLAIFYLRQGRWPEAEAAFKKALAINPGVDGASFELGLLYKDQGRLPEAEAAFQRSIACGLRKGASHLELGNVYRRQGRWREAEAGFKEAISIEPENDRAYMGLWAIYCSQGRTADAEAASRKALAMNVRNAWACAGVSGRGAQGLPGPSGTDAPLAPSLVSEGPVDLTRDQVSCLLPWTHLCIPNDGLLRPCCDWSGPPLGDIRSSPLVELWNSPGMKALRSDMMSGRPVAGCRGCYKSERAGLFSRRQSKSIEWDHCRDRKRLTASDGALPWLPLPYLEIRCSNVCNLRCRTCDPAQSSAWAADARALGLPVEGGPIQRSYDDWDSLWRQLQPLLEEGLETIHFVGGEPLVMEEHYRILEFLIARGRTDVRLLYNTNFSTLRFQGRDMIDLWSRFRDVKVIASLDGSGRRGEYIRKGLRWETAVANREEMLRRCPDVGFSINATLSIFNALHLPDFHREWVEKGYVERNELALNILRGPALYRMQVLPAALKQQVLASYQRHRDSFLDADGSAARDFSAATRFLEAQDRSELLPEFVAMTRRLDQLRGEDCREVFPELAGLFEAAE